MLKINRILVPMDFSKESDLALRWAEMTAEAQDAAIAYKAELEALENKLRAAQRKIAEGIFSYTLCEKGKVPQVIADVCSKNDIDLVVMTTRGRQEIKHFLSQSATEETIRLAPCPVVVLHLNAKNQPALKAP